MDWYCWAGVNPGHGDMIIIRADLAKDAATKYAQQKRLSYGTAVHVVQLMNVAQFKIGIE